MSLYIYFSFACYFCNSVTTLFSNFYRSYCNIFYIFADYYEESHPESDFNYDDLVRKIKTEAYIKFILHTLALLIMVKFTYIYK